MKKLITFLFFTFLWFYCFSYDYETVASGDWKSGATWQGGIAAPNNCNQDKLYIHSGDTVVLNDSLTFKNDCELQVAGHLTINGNLLAINNLKITVTGSLTINGNLTGKNGQTITISGNITVSGNIVAENNGNINLQNGTLNVGGSLTGGVGCQITGTGTINLSGENNYDDTPASGITLNENLPVQLLFFDAVCSTNSIRIEWSTATETNSSTFVLLKSPDASQYEAIATLPAAGNSNKRLDYSFQDNILLEKTYYMLKQIDNDGASENYGPIVSSCQSERDFHLFVNSATDELTFEAYHPYTGMTLKIFDLSGNFIRDASVSKTRVYKLPLNDLSNGIYFVQVQIDGKPEEIIKIVK